MSKRQRRLFSFKHRQRLPALAVRGAATLVKLLRRTYRVTVVDRAGLGTADAAVPAIFALWHNRLLITPALVPKNLLRQTAALASQSRDGQYAADFMRCFGMQVVRGSTSRGGHQALRRMTRKLSTGMSVAVTPDGPRGPKYRLQTGVIMLAEMTQCPIIPLSFNAAARWELHGWDRTQIPRPLARVEFIIGAPIRIQGRLDAQGREKMRLKVEGAMLALTQDQKSGRRDEWLPRLDSNQD